MVDLTNNAIRNVVPIKSDQNQDLTVIILAAGASNKMRSHGIRSLIKVTPSKTLIEYQLDLIHNTFHSYKTIVVGGFECDRLFKNIPSNIIKVENEAFESTNNCRSIGIGLHANGNCNRVLFIFGDLFFNSQTLINANYSESHVWLDKENLFFNDENIGCSYLNNYAENFIYSTPNKWVEIVYLTNYELQLMKQFVWNRNNDKKFAFEGLNYILEKEGKLKIQSPQEMKITDLDCVKDFKRISEII